MWLDIHTFTVYIILYKNIVYACYRYTLPFCVRRNLYVPAFDLSDAFRSFLGAGAALEAMCHLPRTYHEHHGTWHPIFQSSQGQTHLRSRITIESRVVFQCLSDVRTWNVPCEFYMVYLESIDIFYDIWKRMVYSWAQAQVALVRHGHRPESHELRATWPCFLGVVVPFPYSVSVELRQPIRSYPVHRRGRNVWRSSSAAYNRNIESTQSYHAIPGFQKAQSLESRYTARLLGYILLRFFLSLSMGVSAMMSLEVWALDEISDFCGLTAIIEHRNMWGFMCERLQKTHELTVSWWLMMTV